MFLRTADLDERGSRIRDSWFILIMVMIVSDLMLGDSGIMRLLTHTIWATNLRPLTKLITNYAMYPFYLFFLGLIAFGFIRKRPDLRRLAYAYFLAQIIGSAIVVRTLKIMVGRHRPDLHQALAGVDSWIGPSFRSAYHSFPSGHTADLFTSAIFLAILLRKSWSGIVLLYAALIVGLSRIILSSHYPTDVIAGAMVGGIISLVTIRYWLRPQLVRIEQTRSR